MLNSNEHRIARLGLLRELWQKQGLAKEFHIRNFTTSIPDLENSLLSGRDIGWSEDSVLVVKMHFWEKGSEFLGDKADDDCFFTTFSAVPSRAIATGTRAVGASAIGDFLIVASGSGEITAFDANKKETPGYSQKGSFTLTARDSRDFLADSPEEAVNLADLILLLTNAKGILVDTPAIHRGRP